MQVTSAVLRALGIGCGAEAVRSMFLRNLLGARMLIVGRFFVNLHC